MDFERLNAGLGIVKQQFVHHKPVHAYLLTGARGLGKRTFAKVLASALFCTSEKKPCGRCEACRRVMDGNEPDFLEVYADSGTSIVIDQIREIIQKVSQHAFGTGYRVVLIEPVEKMTSQAQNCLLKSLEEPVSNVVFLLLTHELTATLGTIASRCIRVKMNPWPDEILQNTLQELGHAPQDVETVLARCGGNIGTAVGMLAERDTATEEHQFAMDVLSTLTDASAVSFSTKLKEDKGGADGYLNAIEQAIHQALLVRTGRLSPAYISTYPLHWQKAAEHAPAADINALLISVFETRKRKAGQVNWQSNIDHLMIRLLEEHRKWQQL